MPRVSMVVRHLLNREGSGVTDHVLLSWINEFSLMLEELGHSLEVWQEGKRWNKVYYGVGKVFAIPEKDPHAYSLPNVNQAMWESSADISLAVYQDPLLAYPQPHQVSITLGQSIPSPDMLADRSTPQTRREWKNQLMQGISSVNHVVTNNTQFIQWVISNWPGLSHKLKHIPDFLEPEPSHDLIPKNMLPTGDTVRIVFPCPALPRFGTSEALRAVNALLDKYPQVEFYFCGILPPSIEKHMQKWVDQRPRCYLKGNEKINYNFADIVLFPIKREPVPVKSVIEAMEAGAVVIGSMWGPLVDFIISGYNGLLIKPTDTDIFTAIERLIENPAFRENLGIKAQETRKSFKKDIWKSSWQSLINELLRGEVK